MLRNCFFWKTTKYSSELRRCVNSDAKNELLFSLFIFLKFCSISIEHSVTMKFLKRKQKWIDLNKFVLWMLQLIPKENKYRNFFNIFIIDEHSHSKNISHFCSFDFILLCILCAHSTYSLHSVNRHSWNKKRSFD